MVLRVRPGFDPLKAGVGPDEYFVLSRVDGKQTVREVLLSTGLPIDRGIAIVHRLRSLGAVLLPGETATTPPPAPPPPAPPPGAPKPTVSRTATPISTTPAQLRPPAPVPDVPTVRLPPNVLKAELDAPTMRRAAGVAAKPELEPEPPPGLDLRLAAPTAEEVAALTEDCDLPDTERRRILAMQRLVAGKDPWALLGVARGADAKVLKRAYFKLSKDIHPDRYYGRRLGSFADRLAQVFEATSRAYAKLTAPEAARATAPHPVVGQDQPQTPQEYAAELFARACEVETSGEPLEAMKLFAAAVRVDPQTRFLRRAASCALAAQQPKTAIEYAKKAQAQAPSDPSLARLLAASYRAGGKLGDAEEVLVMAMAMKSENDALTAELRHDLAEVRRLLAASP